MPATSPQPDELSFEDAMERLEEIVSAMEGERMPLEDMVQSYAEGARLLKQCRSRIDTARQRVELITADLDGTTARATLSTFDEAAAEAAAESTAKPRSGNTRRSPAKPAPDDAGDDDIRLF